MFCRGFGVFMILIAGLGNPEKKYENTRHNIGFDAVDYLAKKHGIPMHTMRFRGFVGTGVIGGQKVVLLKPVTYMNLSGESIRAAVDFYKIDPETELIVIEDDISLPLGDIRVRAKGSAGGHNGLKNIILHLGTDGFARVRIGIGDKPEGRDLVSHVLGHFTTEERKIMDNAVERAGEAVELFITDGIDKAMNEVNKKGSGKQ